MVLNLTYQEIIIDGRQLLLFLLPNFYRNNP